MPNPESRVPHPESRIRSSDFGIRNPDFRIVPSPASRIPAFLALFLAVVLCWIAPAALAQSAAEKRERAEAYYQKAVEVRQALEQTPEEQRTAREYLGVIQAFRRVYRTDPAYGNNTLAILAIGELFQEMGRRGSVLLASNSQQEKYFHSAIEAYEFLLKEYPTSKLRFDARLAIARMYREDLKQPEEALKQYQRYVADHRRSPQTKEARRMIEAIQTELAARKKELEEPPQELVQAAPPAAPAKLDTPAGTAKVNKPEAGPAPEPPDAPEARSQPAAPLAQVTGIRHWVTPDYTRLVIDVEREVKYGVGRLGNPPRVYIDLFETRPIPAISGKTLPIEDGLLKRVKTGRHKVNVTRVVLYVGNLSEYSLFELPNPYRLIVDVHNRVVVPRAPEAANPAAPRSKQPARPAAPAMAAKGRKETPNPVVATEPPATPEPARQSRDRKGAVSVVATESPATAEPAEVAKAVRGPVFERVKVAKPNRDGTRSLTRALGLKIGRILLDPGHGGRDTGTIGPGGLYEKDLVLDVALRLGQLIEERLGSEVLYTRQDDSFVPLETRTALGNENQADLFLSIHANSSRSPRARGVETYYLNFTTDPAALEVAARENAVSQERISELQGLVRKIAMQEKMDESKEFAGHVQTALWRTQPTRSRRLADRGVKKAPFVVLIGANMPSVLAEIAFLSNPQDEKLLQTSEHRQKMAAALYSGIVAYAETLSGVKVALRETERAAAK